MNRFNSFLFLMAIVLGTLTIEAQRRGKTKNSTPVVSEINPPKLVVGIVVDQMRYDYLTRFWGHYGEDGFKRLIGQGFHCKNHHFNYAPTSTGPGHASIYTGTTPATHGIIGNNWYDKLSDKMVYCASDDGYNSVGTLSEEGKMSPHRMMTTTITDQLRLHTQMRGKTIAIALKDRGAVLPGGHMANAAFWFEGNDLGKWITSSYYMDQLPKWVNEFNTSGLVKSYKRPWKTLKDINVYVESGLDNTAYESVFEGESTPVFPHSTPNLLSKTKDFDILKYTPFGNSITVDFALAAIAGENLGQDDVTDFLAISFSSTDYVGHKFGVNSKEVQDTYLRLDRDLARLLVKLDGEVGKNAYTVFLTSDHGAGHVAAFLKDQKIPAGYMDTGANKKRFNQFLKYRYGTTDLVRNMSNNQVFLDHKVVNNLDMDLNDIQEEIALELLGYDGINKVFTAYQMWQNQYVGGIPHILQNGWHQKRSGDVLFVQKPGFVSYSRTGSTHGSPMVYDTHVPLVFFGNGIKKGETSIRTETPDIAATLAIMLGTGFPNGTTGTPIVEVLK